LSADTTAARYLDVLAGTFMVRRLPAWFENIGKRQVKTPKIYFRDTGIYHRLVNIPDRAALVNHPRLGASWEGLALEQLIRASGASDEEVFFWGVHGQAELDLLIFSRGKRLGYEVKYTDRPRSTRSQHLALEHLHLDQLTVVIPGDANYALADDIGVELHGQIDARDGGADARIEGQALRALGVEGALRGADGTEAERFRAFASVRDALRTRCARAPVLVVLDDLHAADEASLDLLLFVARGLRGTRLALLGTARDSGRYSVVVRFTTEAITPIMLPPP
jgi:hypothetical protein